MKSIALIAVSALCGCRSPSPVPVATVTERVRSIPVKDSLSLTALIRVDTLKRIVLSEVQASATPNMRYRLSLDTLPDASRLKLDVYNVRDSVRLIERDSVVFVPVQKPETGKPDYWFLFLVSFLFRSNSNRFISVVIEETITCSKTEKSEVLKLRSFAITSIKSKVI